MDDAHRFDLDNAIRNYMECYGNFYLLDGNIHWNGEMFWGFSFLFFCIIIGISYGVVDGLSLLGVSWSPPWWGYLIPSVFFLIVCSIVRIFLHKKDKRIKAYGQRRMFASKLVGTRFLESYLGFAIDPDKLEDEELAIKYEFAAWNGFNQSIEEKVKISLADVYQIENAVRFYKDAYQIQQFDLKICSDTTKKNSSSCEFSGCAFEMDCDYVDVEPLYLYVGDWKGKEVAAKKYDHVETIGSASQEPVHAYAMDVIRAERVLDERRLQKIGEFCHTWHVKLAICYLDRKAYVVIDKERDVFKPETCFKKHVIYDRLNLLYVYVSSLIDAVLIERPDMRELYQDSDSSSRQKIVNEWMIPVTAEN